jgi:hypothetical protein
MRATTYRRGRPRANPEAKLQAAVREYLVICLPEPPAPGGILWTASLTGTFLSPAARSRAKAMGVRRGFPDLQFVFPDGVTRYIELKAPASAGGGSLSTEQRDFRDFVRPHAIWAVCRSIDEVAATLRGWGARLRDDPRGAPWGAKLEAAE